MSSAPAGLEKKKCEKDKIVRDLIALVEAEKSKIKNLFQQPPFARIFRSAPDSVIDDTDFTREKTRREVSRALANWRLRLQCAGGFSDQRRRTNIFC